MRLARALLRSRRRSLHSRAPLGDIGQPTHETHPHLCAPGEVTPGISGREYAARRAALLAQLPSGSVAVLHSAPVLRFAGTVIPVPSVYRQDADFYYLTGVAQPDCIALLAKARGGEARFSLLVPPPCSRDRTWHGARVDAAAATAHFGADEAGDSSQPAAALREVLDGASCLYVPGGSPEAGSPLAAALARAPGLQTQPLRPLLDQLRWVKSGAEQALMRAAAAAACAGLRAAAAAAQPGATEAFPAAAHEAAVRRLGAQRLPYPSVVAGGPRGAAVHYGRYDGALHAPETLLMDAGCELHGYVADVTRTWPLQGGFEGRMRQLYLAVRGAHAQALAACRPGASLAQLHARSVETLCEALSDLGVLAGGASALRRSGAYHSCYPTALGHYLGLDTHDTAGVALSQPLRPGVVLTIEPGLYLAAHNEAVAPAWRGMGVRIEDDVLVTEDGCEVLSAAAPVDADAVGEWATAARAEAQAAGY